MDTYSRLINFCLRRITLVGLILMVWSMVFAGQVWAASPVITITVTGNGGDIPIVSASDNVSAVTTMKYKIIDSKALCNLSIMGDDAVAYIENATVSVLGHSGKRVCFSSTNSKNEVGFGVSDVIAVGSSSDSQCEYWLERRLSTQDGFQHAIGNISNTAIKYNYGWVRTIGYNNLPWFTPVSKESGLQVTNIQTKAVTNSDFFKKMLWILTVRNSSDKAKSFTAEIKWLDSDGFMVDYDTEYNLVIDSNEEKHFTGYAYVTGAADAASSVSAKITYKDLINTAYLALPINN